MAVRAFFAYSTNYLIDLDNAIIVDVEAPTAIRQAEGTATKRMIERAGDRLICIQSAWLPTPKRAIHNEIVTLRPV